jgi:hypothetical protein
MGEEEIIPIGYTNRNKYVKVGVPEWEFYLTNGSRL